MKKYVVTLTAEERQSLHGLTTAGKAAATKLARARILLKADASDGGPAWPDHRIAEALEVSTATIERVRHMRDLSRLGKARFGDGYLTERLVYSDRFAWCRLASKVQFNPKNRKRGSGQLLADYWQVYGSSRFREAVEVGRLRGLVFGSPTFDPIRGDRRSWYACLPGALAGRGLDHP